MKRASAFHALYSHGAIQDCLQVCGSATVVDALLTFAGNR